MIVVKFGGSSLAGPERMLAAAHIVAAHVQYEPVVCVVSAMAGVTDQLLSIAAFVMRGTEDWRPIYSGLRQSHEETLAALATPLEHAQLLALRPLWDALATDANGLASVTEGSSRKDAIAAFSAWGERLSVQLFAAALARVGLEASAFEDAPVIIERLFASPHDTASVPATRAWLREPISNLLRWGQTPVLPGYLAMTQEGLYTTLGRNGSDYSAAAIAAALDANAVYLYSDVAGIHETDPRIAPQAKLLASLTYAEATAIAARGARVLHPATIPPLAERCIPLRLRSARDPGAPGTDISGAKDPVCAHTRHAEPPMCGALLAYLAQSLCTGKAVRPDAF